MNDTCFVTIKHPNGLRRTTLALRPETTSGECLLTLIRGRFIPRTGPHRRYRLVPATGQPYFWNEPLTSPRRSKCEVLQVIVDVQPAHGGRGR